MSRSPPAARICSLGTEGPNSLSLGPWNSTWNSEILSSTSSTFQSDIILKVSAKPAQNAVQPNPTSSTALPP